MGAFQLCERGAFTHIYANATREVRCLLLEIEERLLGKRLLKVVHYFACIEQTLDIGQVSARKQRWGRAARMEVLCTGAQHR